MPLSGGMSLLIILVVAITTFTTRVIPFLVFPKGKKIPDFIQYLGKVLTPAVIGMLVIYCLKNTKIISLTLLSWSKNTVMAKYTTADFPMVLWNLSIEKLKI